MCRQLNRGLSKGGCLRGRMQLVQPRRWIPALLMYLVSIFPCNNEQIKSGLWRCRGSWEPTGPRSGDYFEWRRSHVFPLRRPDCYQVTASRTTALQLKATGLHRAETADRSEQTLQWQGKHFCFCFVHFLIRDPQTTAFGIMCRNKINNLKNSIGLIN